jgi:hypothetical protein
LRLRGGEIASERLRPIALTRECLLLPRGGCLPQRSARPQTLDRAPGGREIANKSARSLALLGQRSGLLCGVFGRLLGARCLDLRRCHGDGSFRLGGFDLTSRGAKIAFERLGDLPLAPDDVFLTCRRLQFDDLCE